MLRPVVPPLRISRVIRRTVCACVCLCITTLAVPPSPASATTPPTTPSPIQWLEWGAAAFERARAEDKLILLDLTAVWCHACHVMEATTYSAVDIITRLRGDFIPVRVDIDQRPDVAARYKHGGWPTTSVLLPSGEIVFQANFLSPEDMTDALRGAADVYREDKHGMTARAADVWARVASAQRARTRPDGPLHPARLIPRLLDTVQRRYDHVNGGFGDAPKFFEPDILSFILTHHFWQKDAAFRRMAFQTLDKQVALYDPVWGGFFRYAEGADWSTPHYEKLLSVQASNLLNYLDAYHITGSAQYREVVEGTLRYVTQFLFDRERGGFYASQDAGVRRRTVDGNVDVDGAATAPVDAAEFFALDASRRRDVGMPAIDRTRLTDGNGLMATALLRVFQVMGDTRAKSMALTTLQRLYTERHQRGRGLAHFLRDGHPQQFGLLADHVFFAEALIEAFLTTGERVYLAQAETVIADATRLLEDAQGGGYVDRAPTSSALGLLKFPHKDLRVNASLSMVLSDLFYLTRDARYRQQAERLLQFITARASFPVAQTGRALHRFHHYPVHIVVVGDTAAPAARRLFHRSLAAYIPGKIVRFLDPRVDPLSIGDVTFPSVPGPHAYICTDRLCSNPVSPADSLPDHIHEFFTALTASQAPFPSP